MVAGNLHLINRRRKWRLNFDPILITELISAGHVSNEDRPVIRKFPDHLTFGSRRPPLADNAGIPAAPDNQRRKCPGGYGQETRASEKNNSHHCRVIIVCACGVEPKRTRNFDAPACYLAIVPRGGKAHESIPDTARVTKQRGTPAAISSSILSLNRLLIRPIPL